jgi:hypothetical protein
MLVHHPGETIVVDDQVLEAPRGLLCEFEIQPDPAGIYAASAPFRLHRPDAPVGGVNAQERFPFREKRRNKFAETVAVPTLQDPIASTHIRPGSDPQIERGSAPQYDAGWPPVLDDSQPIPSSEEIVGLAADQLPSRLARLVRESGALALDPPKLPHHGKPDSMIRDGQGRGHTDATVRRVHAKVQVLDGFADDLNRQTPNHDLAAFNIHAGS